MRERGERAPAHVRGFTLIELMVTIAVLAVIVAMATPSFAGIINSNRLASASNDLVAGLQLARMEAIRRNAPVVMCASGDAEAATPSCSTTGWGQWIMFADPDRNGVFGSGDTLIRVAALHPSFEVTSTSDVGDKVVFAADGLAYSSAGALVAGAINICLPTTRPAENNRNVNIDFGSTVNISTGTPNPECSDDDDP